MSAVPAAELMAREDVLGSSSPAAATMGTTSKVILFPGHPPMEWKSNTGERSNLMTSPVSTMAMVRSAVSRMFMPLISSEVTYAVSSMLLRLCSAMSFTMVRISAVVSSFPAIFFLMNSTEAGLEVATTSMISSASGPSSTYARPSMPTSPGCTTVSVVWTSVTTALRSCLTRTRSCSLTPISLASSTCRTQVYSADSMSMYFALSCIFIPTS